MIENIIEKAKKDNKKVYIYAHKFPDGDAISSSCALVQYLKNKGIDASYVVTNAVYSYTQVVGEIPLTKSVEPNSISIILDTSTLDYLENKLFSGSNPYDMYVIDHHLKTNGMNCIEDELNLSDANVLRDSSTSSTCEILVNEFKESTISPEIANMLTLGLITDTAKLKFLKPHTLKNLQALLEAGADYNHIISLCTRKSSLKNEVGLAKILLNSQKFSIGDTYGIILPIDNKTVASMSTQYGLRAIQKKIFKMADLTNCSFNCMFAENAPGEFDLEFRSTPVYGNFNVQKLALMYGGGGHFNASGCHLSRKNGYNAQSIFSAIKQYASDTYSEQATGLKDVTLSDTDIELTKILDHTDRLTKNVTPQTLAKVNELNQKGANYDYTFKQFKTFETFMLENEILSRIPSTLLNKRSPIVNISLSPQDVDILCKKYKVQENDLLTIISCFSNIDISSASITLPNGKRASIDRNGNITIYEHQPNRPENNDFSK